MHEVALAKHCPRQMFLCEAHAEAHIALSCLYMLMLPLLVQVVAHNMEANCGLGLQIFGQTLPQMQETRELLESLLACEFVGLANFSQVWLKLPYRSST